MLFFYKNGKNIFRLAALLCLFFVFKPDFAKKQLEIPAAEHGIGGGSLSGEVIFADFVSETEEGVILSPASLETVEFEPESFSRTPTLLYHTHTVQRGENISELAVSFGLNQDSIISVNKVTNSRLLQAGKVIKIPNQDGILHTVKNGDTLNSIAKEYKADAQAIQTANELFSENIKTGTDLFIPGAKLDWNSLQEINGDLFIWPVSGIITSPYGYRRSPFTGNRQFHSGMDIKGSMGTPIRAAMAGRVSMVGYDNVFGNYVMISHHSGYRTLYGHMSVIRTKTNAYVGTGERIGDVGSTGQSTGPHLHFMVYKNGVTVNPRSLVK